MNHGFAARTRTMSNAITISLAVNATLGLGWLARTTPAKAEVWQDASGLVDFVRVQFSRPIDSITEMPMPWNPTKIAIRIDDGELDLLVYGSLEAPETWRPKGPPVVYVYPDADVTVGDVIAALDVISGLAPKDTIVVTELVTR